MSEWKAETRLCMICGTRGFRAKDSEVTLADGRTMYHEKACTFHELGQLRGVASSLYESLKIFVHYYGTQDGWTAEATHAMVEYEELVGIEYEEPNV